MTEESLAEWIVSASSADLLSLLPEQHSLYAERSTSETTRIRGFALAAFGRTGLPDDALPYVLEELESGRDPYLVAAAARALRGRRPDPAFVPFLRKAETNIRAIDAPVTFDVYKPRWPFSNATSAVAEIRKTLASIDPSDDCCTIPSSPSRSRKVIDPNIELEDQDGQNLRFADFFHGKLSVVAFFYTRCDNPEKCSLTITKLARLQQAIERGPLNGQVRIAAITYDPHYDLPHRLRRFGANRGLRFHEDARFFRTPGRFDDLRAAFDLGVNFAGSIVNRHRIELYVLDARGETVATFSRMQFDVDSILAELQSQLSPPPRPRWQPLLASIPTLFLALLPKCPLCLGAYLSALGLGSMQMFLRSPWTIPLTIALLLLHLWVVHRRTRETRDTTPLALAALGTLALLAGSVLWDVRLAAIAGATLLVAASLFGSRVRSAPSCLVRTAPATRSRTTGRCLQGRSR